MLLRRPREGGNVASHFIATVEVSVQLVVLCVRARARVCAAKTGGVSSESFLALFSC